MRIDIEDVADRIRHLTAPSRELDCLVAATIGWGLPGTFLTADEALEQLGLIELVDASVQPDNAWAMIPRFTDDAEAALRTLPEHSVILACAWWPHPEGPQAVVNIAQAAPSAVPENAGKIGLTGKYPQHEGRGTSMARAILVASMLSHARIEREYLAAHPEDES